MDNRLSRRIRAIFLSRVEEVEAESCTIPKCRYSDCRIISDDVQHVSTSNAGMLGDSVRARRQMTL